MSVTVLVPDCLLSRFLPCQMRVTPSCLPPAVPGSLDDYQLIDMIPVETVPLLNPCSWRTGSGTELSSSVSPAGGEGGGFSILIHHGGDTGKVVAHDAACCIEACLYLFLVLVWYCSRSSVWIPRFCTYMRSLCVEAKNSDAMTTDAKQDMFVWVNAVFKNSFKAGNSSMLRSPSPLIMPQVDFTDITPVQTYKSRKD